MADALERDVVVSTQWVFDHLNDNSIVIVEVNTDLDVDYQVGHIFGAVGWSLHSDLEHQIRRDIPDGDQIEALMARSGIANSTTVVLYGDGNNRSATWAFWVLKYYGHDDVRLMDGGRMKWINEDRPLSTQATMPTRATYTGCTPNDAIRATKQHILDHLGDSEVKLLDTRTYEEYTGQLTSAPDTPQSGIYRKGRIPGAVHILWEDGASTDGSFKSVEELRTMYETQGLQPKQEIVPYCRLGVRASYSWFVLKYLLGYENVRNYDGSWTEWGNSVGVPVETD